ncbi:Cyclin-T1-4 [Bienertia sinuspersici]
MPKEVSCRFRSSLWLQFKPHQIAAGVAYLAAKMLNVNFDSCLSVWREFQTPPVVLQGKGFGVGVAEGFRGWGVSRVGVTGVGVHRGGGVGGGGLRVGGIVGGGFKGGGNEGGGFGWWGFQGGGNEGGVRWGGDVPGRGCGDESFIGEEAPRRGLPRRGVVGEWGGDLNFFVNHNVILLNLIPFGIWISIT